MLRWLFSRRRTSGASPPAGAGEAPLTLDQAVRAGLQHHQAGRRDRAEAIYRQVLAVDPDHFDAIQLLGAVLAEGGDFDGAVAALERAVELNPRYQGARDNLAGAYRDRGVKLHEQGRLDEAAESLSRALAVRPQFAEAHYDLGNVLTHRGDWEAALEQFRAALSLRPDFAAARWAGAMAQIPAVCEAEGEPATRREAFARELEALEAWFRAAPRPEGFRAVAVQQPFYLAYQERDNRDLLARYGKLCADLMAPWQAGAGLAPAGRARRSRIRLGFVSAQVYDHSVWGALTRGWLERLDRSLFELHIFHLGTHQDAETRIARSLADAFSEGKRPFDEWARLIHEAAPDALIYPEIGMDATTAKLASLRLAPLQAASWGHPETSGLPTIDYFLSAEDLEPADAQRHYTEKLVQLPRLGTWLPRRAIRAGAGGEAPASAAPLLICAGNPFKYAPAQDRVLVEIARRLGRCELVFFEGHPRALSQKLHRRLREAFRRAGLDYERHVRVVPWQTLESFRGMLGRADLFLDTIGFSGFNTAMHAVECGLPIVAREGRFMRGRLASGILKRMQLDELVAPSDDAYVDLAVALAEDRARRQALRARIESGRERLFEDPAPAVALEQFLLSQIPR